MIVTGVNKMSSADSVNYNGNNVVYISPLLSPIAAIVGAIKSENFKSTLLG